MTLLIFSQILGYLKRFSLFLKTYTCIQWNNMTISIFCVPATMIIFQIQVFILYNPISQISVAPMCLCGATKWSIRNLPLSTFSNRNISPFTQQLWTIHRSSIRRETWIIYLMYAKKMLPWFCSDNHGCYAFVSTVAMLRAEKSTSQSSLHSPILTLFSSSLPLCSHSLRGRVLMQIANLVWRPSLMVPAFSPAVYLFFDCFPMQTEASGTNVESSPCLKVYTYTLRRQFNCMLT